MEAVARRYAAAGLAFVPFLSSDNGAGGPLASGSGEGEGGGAPSLAGDGRDAIAVNAESLGALLRLPFADFVAVMAHSEDAAGFMESFIVHRMRPYDARAGGGGGGEDLLELLDRRALMALLRLLAGEHVAVERGTVAADGAAGAAATAAGGGGVWGACASYGELLYERWVVDAPRLVGIAALYGAENGEAIASFARTLVALQPKYWNDIDDALVASMEV
jgi:hypothetical protein